MTCLGKMVQVVTYKQKKRTVFKKPINEYSKQYSAYPGHGGDWMGSLVGLRDFPLVIWSYSRRNPLFLYRPKPKSHVAPIVKTPDQATKHSGPKRAERLSLISTWPGQEKAVE